MIKPAFFDGGQAEFKLLDIRRFFLVPDGYYLQFLVALDDKERLSSSLGSGRCGLSLLDARGGLALLGAGRRLIFRLGWAGRGIALPDGEQQGDDHQQRAEGNARINVPVVFRVVFENVVAGEVFRLA